MENNNFSIRNLSADDIFPMCDIMAKCGVSELKNCFNNTYNDAGKMGAAIAFEITGIVCRNISSCKNEIFAFLSALSGLTAKEIAMLSPADFIRLLKAVFEKKEMKDFFSAVSGLFLSEV
ncbi:MAG: hypothetical protein IJA12_04295 [Oscillospiraceae bacterium]|nr:hypothetical protein [Oscillospiraceae bacterium]